MPNTARIVLLAACWSAAACAADDEAEIERLLARHAPAPTAAPKPHRAKTDPLTAWLDHPVRVDTVDRGLYVGTLHAVMPDSITLDIALPDQTIRYTLPRAAIAAVVARETAP